MPPLGDDDQALGFTFHTAAITLSHDDNGNLTHDGLYEYVYDFLDRLVNGKSRGLWGPHNLGVALPGSPTFPRMHIRHVAGSIGG